MGRLALKVAGFHFAVIAVVLALGIVILILVHQGMKRKLNPTSCSETLELFSKPDALFLSVDSLEFLPLCSQPRQVEILKEVVLSHPERWMGLNAAKKLSKLAEDGAFVRSVSESKEPEVRSRTSRLCSNITLPICRSLLNDPDPWVRVNIAWALRRLDRKSLEDQLAKETHPHIRIRIESYLKAD